ncbi:MAG: TonB family protein [Opitutaceae bacterium]|jgi:colicin import membrane protein|nr:TonB family protein [Opitutaceae bacterium]
MPASSTTQTHSAGPYVISMMLHGAVVLAIALTAMAFQQAQFNTPQPFELVTGEGTNYAATEAPAPSPGIEFQAPDVPFVETPPPPPEPPPDIQPPQPVVQPVQPEARQIPVVVPKPVDSPVKPVEKPAQSTTSWQQFQQQNKNKTRAQSTVAKPPGAKPAVIPKINARQGVPGGTGSAEGAGGSVLSRSGDQDLLGGYLKMLHDQLKAAHEKPTGLGDHLSVTISFTLSATGAMTDVRVTRSSGSAEFDQSALAAFRAVRSIGSRPDGKTDTRTAVFKMSDE